MGTSIFRVYVYSAALTLRRRVWLNLFHLQIVPCDSEFTLSIRINSQTYNIPNESLIQTRTAKECLGAVVAWAEGTAPDQSGRVVLGTPFLAYYYTYVRVLAIVAVLAGSLSVQNADLASNSSSSSVLFYGDQENVGIFLYSSCFRYCHYCLPPV